MTGKPDSTSALMLEALIERAFGDKVTRVAGVLRTYYSGFDLSELARELAGKINEALNIPAQSKLTRDTICDAIMGAAKLHTHDHLTALKIAEDALSTLAALCAVPPQDSGPVSDESLRLVVAAEWGSRICFRDPPGAPTRTCDYDKHCVCMDIARAIKSDFDVRSRHSQEVKALMCEECGVYPADLPSKICPGCEAYREHQR